MWQMPVRRIHTYIHTHTHTKIHRVVQKRECANDGDLLLQIRGKRVKAAEAVAARPPAAYSKVAATTVAVVVAATSVCRINKNPVVISGATMGVRRGRGAARAHPDAESVVFKISR